jgi:hypothetical protein
MSVGQIIQHRDQVVGQRAVRAPGRSSKLDPTWRLIARLHGERRSMLPRGATQMLPNDSDV